MLCSVRRSALQITTVRGFQIASIHVFIKPNLSFFIIGSYPGATAAKVQSEYDNTEKAIVAAEKKLQETQQAYGEMKAARGLGGDEDQV